MARGGFNNRQNVFVRRTNRPFRRNERYNGQKYIEVVQPRRYRKQNNNQKVFRDRKPKRVEYQLVAQARPKRNRAFNRKPQKQETQYVTVPVSMLKDNIKRSINQQNGGNVQKATKGGKNGANGKKAAQNKIEQ